MAVVMAKAIDYSIATRLGKEMYGGWPAVMVACGYNHTLVLTCRGLVWSCGEGDNWAMVTQQTSWC
jgi:alpha-tubulin suppressor-like RCC1 family protein